MTDAPWRCRRRVVVDVALAVGFVLLDAIFTLLGGSWWPVHPGPLAWVLLALQAVACASVVANRRYPMAVIAVLGGFTLLVTLLAWPVGALVPAHDGNLWAPFATTFAAYSPIAAARSRRAALLAVAALTIVVARPWQPSLALISFSLLRIAVGPLVALYLDARRRLVRALTERAERAERERHLLAEQARADERARLAAEMHDVVTHRVSLMVLQAGALRVTAADEPTRHAAEELREAGVQALDELRDLIGILHTDPGDPDGDEPPTTADLAELVAAASAAGTPAELDCAGDPALASPMVGRTAYRVVREALTNVAKHAPGSRVSVRVVYRADGVRVTVLNSRPERRSDPRLVDTGSGIGLSGLRRRIDLVHGTLHAGTEPDGGFRVDATLPAYVPTAEAVG